MKKKNLIRLIACAAVFYGVSVFLTACVGTADNPQIKPGKQINGITGSVLLIIFHG